MPSIKKETTVDLSAQSTFEAVQRLLPELGYEIWKTRPMAYLTQAKGTHDGAPLSLNIMASMMAPTRVTITVSSDGLSEEALTSLADAFLQHLAAAQ